MIPAPVRKEKRGKENMKKLITLLLAAIMCLSFTACRKNQAGADTDNSQKQNTENSRQDGEQTENTSDESGKPETVSEEQQTIEITLDNWQEYFEIRQYVGSQISVNAFDEPSGVVYLLHTILAPKEEYLDRIVDTDAAIIYNADYCAKRLKWNALDFTFEVTGDYDGKLGDYDGMFDVTRNADARLALHTIRQDIVKDGKVVKNRIRLPASAYINGVGVYAWDAAELLTDDFASWTEGEQWKEENTGYSRGYTVNIEITRFEGTITLRG